MRLLIVEDDALLADGLARTLRRSERYVPVIVATAREAITDRVRGLDLGADDYLVKPFAIEELEARVRALIRAGSG